MEGIGTRPHLVAKDAAGTSLIDDDFAPGEVADVPAALDQLDDWLIAQLGGVAPMAIGHRVVHGGPDYSAPTLIDDAVLDRLQQFVPLAPLHQPNNLAPIREIRARYPQIPQVACFDTAFHRHHPEVADRYAISDRWYAEGVRRYGFHGLSYEYVADRLRELDPALAEGRVVVCHLGSGASMCAIHGGRSMDSTMGFTAVDGLPMGTRTGQLDPGVVLYLIQNQGFSPADVERFLYHDGGLKGLSGVSNDMRDLEASDAPGAQARDRLFRLPRRARDRCPGRRDGRHRWPRLHRRHRRAQRDDPGRAWCRLTRSDDRAGAVAWAMSASLRFPSPLIKPDVRISRIRLSDWLHLKAHGMAPR